MASLADTSLTADERVVLDRFAELLVERFSDHLSAIWLFGSSARGEPRQPVESDVDLLVLVDEVSWATKDAIRSLVYQAAEDLGRQAVAWSFSVHINTAEWLAERREIESFFIAEVDRDKVVVAGTP